MRLLIDLDSLNFSSKLQLAQDPGCSLEIISHLSKCESKPIKLACAKNPNSSNEMLSELIDCGNTDISIACTSNPNCDIETILKTLETIPVIISNPRIDEKVMREFYLKEGIKERNHMTLSALADNPNCPTDLLMAMSERSDCYDSLEYSIAGNKNTPPEVLAKFSRHWLEDNSNFRIVRRVLSKNPSTPIPVLHLIRKYDNDSPYHTSDNVETTLRSIEWEIGQEEMEKLKSIQEILYMGKGFIF
jgi:hypothetical protein